MPPSADRSVGGILLAAGASSRMGRNKMLLEIEGQPLVRRAATRAIDAGLSPLVVVLGHDEEEARHALRGLPCTFAFNPAFRDSTSGSLHQGLRALPDSVDATVVLLADMVAVDAEMIRTLVARAAETGAPLAASRYGDVAAPPLFFRRALFPELLAWHGEGCGKAVVRRHEAEAAFVDWPPSALTDLDTPADLDAFLAR
jgi:molybdenum cofactor cytidylyltransferase